MKTFNRWFSGKESTCQCRRYRRLGFDPFEKITWRSKWQHSSVFLPGECHGQRSLEGYSSWGWAKRQTRLSDWVHMHSHAKCIIYNFVIIDTNYLASNFRALYCIYKRHNGSSKRGKQYTVSQAIQNYKIYGKILTMVKELFLTQPPV